MPLFYNRNRNHGLNYKLRLIEVLPRERFSTMAGRRRLDPAPPGLPYLIRVSVGFGLNAVKVGRTFVTAPVVES